MCKKLINPTTSRLIIFTLRDNKMKIIETIKECIAKYLVSAIFGVLILLIGAIYQDVLPTVYPEAVQKLPKEVFLKITTLAIILSLISLALLLAVYLHYRKNLIPKCGVLWDKNKEAYCPACQTLLSQGTFYNSTADKFYHYKCIKCDNTIRLMYEGKDILLDEAKKLLQS